MRSRLIAAAAMAVLATLVVHAGVTGGCKDDSCTKDTDCEMPLICVASACVPVGTKEDVPPVDDGGPGDADAPHADADGDADDGETSGEDGDVPDVPETEADVEGGPCTPVVSVPLNAATSAADADERGVGIRSGTGFAFLARLPGLTGGDGLRFQRFHVTGEASTSGVWMTSGVEMGPSHPMLELPDGRFAATMSVLSGSNAGIWVKIAPATGTGGEMPHQVAGTDTSSGSPTIDHDGTDVIVAWTQSSPGTVELRAQHFSATTGEALGSPVTLASGPTGTGEPRLAWSGSRHALAYFNASDGNLHVLFLDGTLAITNDFPLAPASGSSIVGHPALLWNGTVFGLAWETRGTGSAAIHFAAFGPDAAPVPSEPLGGIALSASESGQLALAWGDTSNEWGLAWRQSRTGRAAISLVRLDGDSLALKDGPVDIRPDTTAGFHPSLAFNAGYYMIVWTENPGTGSYPVYEATYGCSAP